MYYRPQSKFSVLFGIIAPGGVTALGLAFMFMYLAERQENARLRESEPQRAYAALIAKAVDEIKANDEQFESIEASELRCVLHYRVSNSEGASDRKSSTIVINPNGKGGTIWIPTAVVHASRVDRSARSPEVQE